MAWNRRRDKALTAIWRSFDSGPRTCHLSANYVHAADKSSQCRWLPWLIKCYRQAIYRNYTHYTVKERCHPILRVKKRCVPLFSGSPLTHLELIVSIQTSELSDSPKNPISPHLNFGVGVGIIKFSIQGKDLEEVNIQKGK